MATRSGLHELRPRRITDRLGKLLASSGLAAEGRRWAAAHVRRRDAAIRRRRLTRMVRARDAFTADVRELVREAGALRRTATEHLSGWATEPEGTPLDADALRQALAGNTARTEAARGHLPRIRACLGAPASRAAEVALREVERLAAYGVEAVEARLSAVDDPERGLLLRASGPGSWIVTPDTTLLRAVDEAVRRFETEAAKALHRAGWDPDRDRWAIR